MKSDRDPFDVLGVPVDVDEEGIRAAYRKASKTSHPDAGGSRESFDEVRDAYEVLMDPKRRERAESIRQSTRKQPIATAFDGFFEDLEKHGRGKPVRPTKPPKARTGEVTLRLSLGQAFHGGTFKVEREGGRCGRCSGKGVLKTQQKHPCRSCQGRGFTREGQGFITVSIDCAICHGSGLTHFVECPECAGDGGGEGFSFNVTVPPGCRDGYRLRKEGMDWLDVVVKIERHPLFTRDIENLIAEVPLDVWDAALGRQLTIKGVDGEIVTLSVPPGTRDGDRVSVPGAGMPAFSGRGDLMVVFRLKVPDANGPLRGLLLEMRRVAGG